MGQQQLLLIVLGVIIVGIAVVVGINVFSASSVQANRDAVVADMMTIGNMAFQHYKKPQMLGGGGNSFIGFEIPKQLRVSGSGTDAKTPNGNIKLTVVAGKVDIEGLGNENGTNGTSPIKYTLEVNPSGLKNVNEEN